VSETVTCNRETVPEALKALPRWLCWRYEKRGGKLTKVPYDGRTGQKASSTDPSSWTDFASAVNASVRYDGAGVVLGDGLAGVDLDGSVTESGELKPWAAEIVERLGSYTEWSPSRRGVKVFLWGQLDRLGNRRNLGDGHIEIYWTDRYFTVTGRHLPGTPTDIQHRQAEFDALHRELFPPKEPAVPPAPCQPLEVPDQDLLARMFRAANGAAVRRLWEGDTEGYPSHSEADCALCSHLAFWTGADAERIDRMFRKSGLCRPKWIERADYRSSTIAKALEGLTDTYSPPPAPDPAVDLKGILGQDGATPGEADQPPEEETPVRLGDKDPETGRIVLSPRRTLPTARAFIKEFYTRPEWCTIQSYAGLLMSWRGNRYAEVEDEAVRNQLLPWLHDAVRYVTNRKTGELELVPFEANPGTVKSALDSVRIVAHLPASTTPPAWLAGGGRMPDAREILPCRTCNLHIPTRRQLPATPRLFTTNALEFDYDPAAPTPSRWLAFLDQLWGSDTQQIELLQEWAGYCLTANTSQQKMLLMVGPRRSGKGTIARVLTGLVGKGNVCGPTISSLAGGFGLQHLIGKSLGIVSDARFVHKDIATVVERLLCISGEDALTIDRKFLASVTMRLPTRLMFLSNELPKAADASRALAGRFLVLQLTESFYGREDKDLTARLTAELPGILLWALEGWDRLRRRGRFVQPDSSEAAIQEMEDLTSPVGAFVRARCEVGPGQRVWVETLYQAWCEWCITEGWTHPTTKQSFGRDLTAAVPGLARRRGSDNRGFYEGIGLREGRR
jgi:putative DNA primase/helicase